MLASETVSELSAASQNYDLKCMRAMFNELIRLNEWSSPNPLTSIKLIQKSELELSYVSQKQNGPYISRALQRNLSGQY